MTNSPIISPNNKYKLYRLYKKRTESSRVKYISYKNKLRHLQNWNKNLGLRLKSSRHDDISSSIREQVLSTISEPLAHVINVSPIDGIVLDKLKIAKVKPIFNIFTSSFILVFVFYILNAYKLHKICFCEKTIVSF